jgi:AraC-like DNA-binding protein
LADDIGFLSGGAKCAALREKPYAFPSDATLAGHARLLSADATVLRWAVADRSSISGVVPFLVATAARVEGADAAAILGPAGLAPDAPPPGEEHVGVDVYLDVWRRALARIADAAFPLRASSAFQLEELEIFGFLAISCKTLGEAYEKTAAVRALYCVGARWEMQNDASATRVIWYPWPGDAGDAGYRAAMDYAVADMANAIRRLGRAQPQPVAVRLAHRAPAGAGAGADVAPFAAHYGVAPTFDSPLYELVYPPGTHEMPIASFNSKLRDYFEAECRRLVDELGSGTGIAEQVRKALIHLMDGGDTSIEKVARRLGMSGRSLQRRLADEGTGYNDLLTEVRAEFAKRYLARKTVSASEVAYLLGFTEPPAFFKAFKRWTGMTPREFQSAASG